MAVRYPARKKSYIGLNTDFIPSKEQLKWFKHCNDNGIIIAPKPIDKSFFPEEWKIAVSFQHNYKKVNLSPTIYTSDNIHEELYKTMKYYYDKHTG